MALKLDQNGYNRVFRDFAKFAQQSMNAGDDKAVANARYNRLDGRKVLAVTNSVTDSVHNWTRGVDEWIINDRTRDLFKQAIVDMFGGEARIPASVKKAMLLGDYGEGKPLTARRIIAVKAAIDADGSVKLNIFGSPEAKQLARSKGWTNAELPKLARAAHFLSMATGVNEAEAIEQLSTPGSKANRLMNYGGRFLDSAGNFANGLRLMDGFQAWFTDIFNTMKPVHQQAPNVRDFGPANTFTKLNASPNLLYMNNLKGLEMFAFEELAANPRANLAETDMEKLFGFKNNKAMYCIGTGLAGSCCSTLANIPREKRAVMFAAFTAFTKPARNANEARAQNMGNGSRASLDNAYSLILMSRILKNFDRAEALYNDGKLTAKNIIKEFFSEIPDKGDYDYRTVNGYFDNILTNVINGEDEWEQYADVASGVKLAMENSGLTFAEVVPMLRRGEAMPLPKYLSTGSMPLANFDGTTAGGRELIAGDLYRPDACYHPVADKQKALLPIPYPGFGFNFPGEEKFYTNGTQEGRANITRVGDKVVEMCGAVHVAQANSVMTMLSQSGLSNLRAGLPQVGATSNEHAPVDYTLAKNERTGAITITYTSPEELPFKFSWTATVDVDGNVTTTPMKAERKSLPEDVVTNALNGALQRQGINRSAAKKARAAKLIGELGCAYRLEGKKLDLFANFVVHLKLTDQGAAYDAKYAEDMAKNISKWTEFKAGEGNAVGVGAAETAVQTVFNDLIDDAVADAALGPNSKFFKEDPDVSMEMQVDAGRGDYTFNGQEVKGKDEVIAALKTHVPSPAMRQGLSGILNQASFLMLSGSLPGRGSLPATGAHPNLDAGKLPGIEKLLSRDAGKYVVGLMAQTDDFSYDLVFHDNGTATVTFTYPCKLLTGAGPNEMSAFGTAQTECTINLDLNGNKPVVTDTKLAQSFAI